MKVHVFSDSCMETFTRPADSDDCDVIDVPDAEWSEFQRIEVQYREHLSRFEQRLAQRHAADRQELETLQKRAAEIEARLGVTPKKPESRKQPSAPSPLDETDAGNGVREIETNVSASAFRNELQTLRAQNVARRRRRGLEH